MKSIVILCAIIGCCLAQRCFSPADCKADECCAIPPVRYAVPECQPFRQQSASCIPEQLKQAAGHRSFPNGDTINIKDTYLGMCPCANNLHCTHIPGSHGTIFGVNGPMGDTGVCG